MKPLFPVLATSLIFLSACDIADWGQMERFTQDFHYSYPLQAHGSLSVDTFNGSIEISGWDQETVDISGTKYASTQSAADNLKVEIDHSPGSVSIRVPRSYDRHRREGAKFVIKIPRTALLDRIVTSNGAIRAIDGAGPARLKTSNGSIHVQGLVGNLDAQTSNGAIELLDVEGDVVARSSNGHIRAQGLKGTLDANTSNGPVHAEIVRADRPVRVDTSNGAVDLAFPNGFSREIRVNTNNSGITVHLPSTINAHVMARTSNSSISTDFQVSMRGEINKQHMDAAIGSGGPLIDLSTSNGSIRIAKM